MNAVNKAADGRATSAPTLDFFVRLDDTSARLQSDALLPNRQQANMRKVLETLSLV